MAAANAHTTNDAARMNACSESHRLEKRCATPQREYVCHQRLSKMYAEAMITSRLSPCHAARRHAQQAHMARVPAARLLPRYAPPRSKI